MIAQERHAPSPTERLADYIEATELDVIPRHVAKSAKLRILDILGICIAASELPGPSVLRRVATDWGGKPEAQCIGSDARLPAATAALVNGTLAHSLDFDDTHHASRTHPSAVIVPTVLAMAQREGASGRAALTAAVLGLELVVRIGLVAPGRFHERGLHATSLCGALGAAAAACKVLNVDASAVTNALGISASTASGLREAYLGQATDTKAFHAGWAAHAGITSAQLAAAGFEGPRTVLEGRFGYYNAFVSPDPWDVARLTASLGEVWRTPEIVFKLYPCGSLIHASIDAALSLRATHALEPDDISEVTVVVAPGMVSTVCEPEDQKLNPSSGYEAKFSAQYAVATALLDGSVTQASYSEDRLRDPELRALLARVRYRTDPSMRFPEAYPGGVIVRTQRGETHGVRRPNSLSSANPDAQADRITGKFLGNVTDRIPRDAASELVDLVTHLEDAPDLDRLFQLCRTT